MNSSIIRWAIFRGARRIPVISPEIVAQNSEIVIAVTNSETPVVFGKWFNRPGLVISAGANHWYERELDEKSFELATLVVVDEKEQAKIECGDLMWAIDHGVLNWGQVEELGDVVVGRVPMPDFRKSTIVFESQGLGIHDVAISFKAYELARANQIGQEISPTAAPFPKQVLRT